MYRTWETARSYVKISSDDTIVFFNGCEDGVGLNSDTIHSITLSDLSFKSLTIPDVKDVIDFQLDSALNIYVFGQAVAATKEAKFYKLDYVSGNMLWKKKMTCSLAE